MKKLLIGLLSSTLLLSACDELEESQNETEEIDEQEDSEDDADTESLETDEETEEDEEQGYRSSRLNLFRGNNVYRIDIDEDWQLSSYDWTVYEPEVSVIQDEDDWILEFEFRFRNDSSYDEEISFRTSTDLTVYQNGESLEPYEEYWTDTNHAADEMNEQGIHNPISIEFEGLELGEPVEFRFEIFAEETTETFVVDIPLIEGSD